MSNQKTELSELGEFGLIKRLTNKIEIQNDSTIKGVGDDCAVLKYSKNEIVVTTDMLTEGIHFNLMYVPLKHLGYKAIAVNISDVYAMNAKPKQVTVSLALSSKFSLEAIEQLYQGIHLACQKYGVDLVGGDTTSSLTGLTISVTAIGEVEQEKVVYRDGAKPGNLLCVSGDLGGAYMGLQLLERENEVFKVDPNMQPEFKDYDYLLERQLKPEPRMDVIKMFEDNDVCPTSMIDVSDGLSSEVLHLCEQSQVGCRVYEDKIPYHPNTQDLAQEMNINPIVAALNGGEDYELLFTVDIKDYDKIKNNPLISVLGHITEKEEGANLVTAGMGKFIPLEAQGWNPMMNKRDNE
ncbi:thiamine-phosphate kinase [Prolixibacteraceae bacterium]|nr:thiamine-phosphate kinase [Prolixibacteraceae bacterium]